MWPRPKIQARNDTRCLALFIPLVFVSPPTLGSSFLGHVVLLNHVRIGYSAHKHFAETSKVWSGDLLGKQISHLDLGRSLDEDAITVEASFTHIGILHTNEPRSLSVDWLRTDGNTCSVVLSNLRGSRSAKVHKVRDLIEHTHFDAATYSAFIADRVTMLCRLHSHSIGEPPNQTT